MCSLYTFISLCTWRGDCVTSLQLSFFVMFWGWYMDYISLKDKVSESDFYLFICFNNRPTTSLVEVFRAWVLLPGKVLTIPAISLLSLGTLSSALFPRELW